MIPIYDLSSFENACRSFNLEELADMLICNLYETIHNIWLQQFGKSVRCLFIVTLMIMLGRSDKVHLIGYT
jgi:hypothetical protein